MAAAEYRELKLHDLRGRVNELRTEIFRLRLKMNTEPTTTLKDWRATRKDLARVLTVIRQKERESASK